MYSIANMASARDLASRTPDLLNPLLQGGGTLEYSRLFLHENDGFGYYPRFQSWASVTQRVNAFCHAVREVGDNWAKFLAWWNKAGGDSELAAQLSESMHEMEEAELYNALLSVALNTRASWGDVIVWEAFKAMPSILPCVAEWGKCAEEDFWYVEIQRLDGNALTHVISGEVTHGILHDQADRELAFIFWGYLYPLIQRTQYAPPQDPAKYSNGKIIQLLIPLSNESSSIPFGWISSNIEKGDAAEILRSMNASDVVSAINGLRTDLVAAISSE